MEIVDTLIDGVGRNPVGATNFTVQGALGTGWVRT